MNERVDYKGAVTVPLDEEQAAGALDALAARGVESVAVCLLWSVTNDAHEQAVAAILRRRHPGVYVTLSSAAAPFVGEYERTATTVFNAYIGPRISSYLVNLDQVLRAKGLAKPLMIMQAYGGVLDIEATCRNAVGTIESGPASGVAGTRFLGEMIGERNILATDMGGTTFKVGVVRGRARRARLHAGGATPPGAGAQDLGGVRGRGRRQHRLDRTGDRAAQGGAGGRGREPRSGVLRPRREPSPRSRTPTSSSATSTPIISWAGGCGSTATPRSGRSGNGSRSPWA